jgi:arylsulfatase B
VLPCTCLNRANQKKEKIMLNLPAIFRRSALALALPLALASITAPAVASVAGVAITPNVLLVIIDDIGPEQLGSYAGDNIANAAPASTPNLDTLANNGVRFKNAWGFPVCSPSRAAMYTGRNPLRTLVGDVIEDSSDNTLSSSETTLAEVTRSAGYTSALVGKWHLGDNSANGGIDAPRVAGGFDHHSGILSGALPSYTSWSRYLDGVKKQKLITTYATTYQANDVLNYTGTSAPWFVTLSLNAPHSPYHKPTSGLYTRDLSAISDCTSSSANKRECYKAAIEALDSELGRLMTQLDASGKLANTMIIVVGDNGTPANVADAGVDSSKAKGTVYQRGVRVPMIISGPLVANGGRVTADPVSVTDVFATVAEISGQSQSTGVDSVSLVPYITNSASSALRSTVYTESFSGSNTHNGNAAMRDARYKLIESLGVYIGFYDLESDPEESNNLINSTLDSSAAASLASLKAAFDSLHNH